MSEEKLIQVSGEVTETELKEVLQHIAKRSVMMRRGRGWTPVEKVALKLFHDEVQEYFKESLDKKP